MRWRARLLSIEDQIAPPDATSSAALGDLTVGSLPTTIRRRLSAGFVRRDRRAGSVYRTRWRRSYRRVVLGVTVLGTDLASGTSVTPPMRRTGRHGKRYDGRGRDKNIL